MSEREKYIDVISHNCSVYEKVKDLEIFKKFVAGKVTLTELKEYKLNVAGRFYKKFKKFINNEEDYKILNGSKVLDFDEFKEILLNKISKYVDKHSDKELIKYGQYRGRLFKNPNEERGYNFFKNLVDNPDTLTEEFLLDDIDGYPSALFNDYSCWFDLYKFVYLYFNNYLSTHPDYSRYCSITQHHYKFDETISNFYKNRIEYVSSNVEVKVKNTKKLVNDMFKLIKHSGVIDAKLLEKELNKKIQDTDFSKYEKAQKRKTSIDTILD